MTSNVVKMVLITLFMSLSLCLSIVVVFSQVDGHLLNIYNGYKIYSLYCRGGQTFLLKGQIWNLFFTAGLNFLRYWCYSWNFFGGEKFLVHFCPFFVLFWWLLRVKIDIFRYLNINLIFAMFLSKDKKVQGPHFGHACDIALRLSKKQNKRQYIHLHTTIYHLY